MVTNMRLGAPDAAKGLPRVWHVFSRHPDDRLVLEEIVGVLQHKSPTPRELEMRSAEFKNLVKRAERGELDTHSWGDLQLAPLLWAAKLKLPGNVLVRIYFHEPPSISDRSVVLVVHVKEVRGQETNALQNQHIIRANNRCTQGRGAQWGLGWSSPINGVTT